MSDYIKNIFENFPMEFDERCEQMQKYLHNEYDTYKGVGIIRMMELYHQFSEENYCAGWLYDDSETETEFRDWFVSREEV